LTILLFRQNFLQSLVFHEVPLAELQLAFPELLFTATISQITAGTLVQIPNIPAFIVLFKKNNTTRFSKIPGDKGIWLPVANILFAPSSPPAQSHRIHAAHRF
jgi:hypothetical protein